MMGNTKVKDFSECQKNPDLVFAELDYLLYRQIYLMFAWNEVNLADNPEQVRLNFETAAEIMIKYKGFGF